jgi:hypothetical protein
MKDQFKGDNAKLISAIAALLDLDAKGALVPHGVGGHARTMLEAAAVRLGSKQHTVAATVDTCMAKKAMDEALEMLSAEAQTNPAVAAIQYAIDAGHGDDGLQFLECWNEGNFEACRREWPDAPDDCYIGADPLFVPTPEGEPT